MYKDFPKDPQSHYHYVIVELPAALMKCGFLMTLIWRKHTKQLFFTLTLTLIPFYTFAYEGTISQSGSCGATDADCHYDLYEDGHLEISGTGRMNDFWYEDHPDSGYPERPWGNAVTSVKIQDGIKSIGEAAFRNTQLTEITIPKSIEEIGRVAFQACRKLESATIDKDSKLKLLGIASFNGTTNLKTIDIPETVTTIGSNAFNFSGIESLVLPDSVFLLENTTNTDNFPFFYGLSTAALSDVSNIFCSETMKEKCEEYFNQAQFFENGQYYPIKNKANLAIYTFDGDKFYVNGKWYEDINDINKGKYFPKRIYTIDEANRVAGTKNRVSIKYR